jgi:hypothetical protein
MLPWQKAPNGCGCLKGGDLDFQRRTTEPRQQRGATCGACPEEPQATNGLLKNEIEILCDAA